MSDTLEALHRAVIDSPEDRTVRLVYADALDETGDKADAARAEFIRAQIELQAVPEPERRHYELASRCRELFEEHWLAWWRPVAAAAGLPEPYVPGKRVRDRMARTLTRRERSPNWPYTHSATHGKVAVHLEDYGVSVRFDAGFPEEVEFWNVNTPAELPELAHRWGDAVPLVRLAFSHTVNPVQWERVDGPHLARLPELTFSQLLPDTAMLTAASPNLAAVTRLAVSLIGPTGDTIGFLVGSPTWAGLRSLRFTGPLGPDAVRDLVTRCDLGHLEELGLVLGNPNALGGAVIQALNEVMRRFMQTQALRGVPVIRWVDFGPPLTALAAAPWVRRLRRLSLRADDPTGLLSMLGERLYGTAERGADLIPDAAVHSLVAAMDPDVLEKLVLPARVIGPSMKEELMTRLGSRVSFG